MEGGLAVLGNGRANAKAVFIDVNSSYRDQAVNVYLCCKVPFFDHRVNGNRLAFGASP